jgi:hypothetical protein
MTIIQDGATGDTAEVTKNHKLKTISEQHALQHENSWETGQTYQVIGTATIANATTTVLHLKNTDTTRRLVVSFMRVQAIDPAGGTAAPAAANYFSVGVGDTVSSGGSAVTPVNVNRTSGNAAAVTATASGPTMGGGFAEIDRWYLDSDGGSSKYDKMGSVILGLNDTLDIRFTSDNTSGTAYARVTFMMIDNDRS